MPELKKSHVWAVALPSPPSAYAVELQDATPGVFLLTLAAMTAMCLVMVPITKGSWRSQNGSKFASALSRRSCTPFRPCR